MNIILEINMVSEPSMKQIWVKVPDASVLLSEFEEVISSPSISVSSSVTRGSCLFLFFKALSIK